MMQLKAISVCNFRKFIDPVMITGLLPGINIIAGDNEDGKSTLVQAVKAAFYTKHSTSSTQAFQPYNSAALPEVEVEFHLDGTPYKLRKSFGKKGVAELRTASSVFNGSEAEEKLHQLLSLGGEKTRENTSIWNVLWVEQGTAFLSPQIGEVGRRTLSTALEGELGRIVSGDEGQQLLRKINDLYLQWYTPKSGAHAANSEFKKAEKELAELTEQHGRLQDEFALYRSTLEEADAVRRKIQHYETNDSVSVARKQWESACAANEDITKKFAEVEKLEAVEKAEQSQYQAVSESWRSRSALIKGMDEYERTLSDIRTKLAELNGQLEETAKSLHACQQQEEEIDQQHAAAESACTALEAAARQCTIEQNIERMRICLEKARAAQRSYAEAQKAAESIKVDRRALDQLRSLEKQWLQADAQLHAVGTKLEFRPDAGNSVTTRGAAVSTGQPTLLTERTQFELSGWGKFTVTPGGEGIDQVRELAARLRKQMDDVLSALAVGSIKEAEEREQEKSALVQKANDWLREVSHHAPTGTERLERELADATAELRRLTVLMTAGAAAIPGVGVAAAQRAALATDDSEQLLSSARARRDQLRQQLTAIRKRTQDAENKFAQVNAAVQQYTGQEKNAADSHCAAAEKIAAARAQESDEQLEHRLLEARHKKEQAEKSRQTLSEQLQGRNPETAKLAVKAAAETLEAIQREIQTLREQQKELSGSLRTFGKAGIAEEFQKSAEKKQQQEEITARLSKKASAIKLLYETLTSAEQRTKSELLQPILTHLDPYISQVFDGGKLFFDPASFAINTLRRAECDEHYDSLSLGTREQLSVLMRLAFAHVLAGNNCPALVILDDALVYSDQVRFEKMQRALERASQSFQILILTCRLRDWENLDAPIFKLSEETASRGNAMLAAGDSPLLAARHPTPAASTAQ